MRLLLITILAVIFITLVSGATKNTKVIRFNPITRDEYNEILKLTNGKTTISEARLISSGLAVLKNFVTHTTRFWPNFWSVFGITQTTSAGIVEDSDNSYPLCVVSTDKQTNIGEYKDGISHIPSMDCIIVVRKSQEEEEENNYEDQYYEDQGPVSMLPDYQYYPYATIPPQHPYPYPPPLRPPPYLPYPYGGYQPYPYYPTFAAYSHQQTAPQYHQPAIPQFPQSELSQPMELEAQHQNQYQSQADFYHQPNYAHFNSPFYPPPLPTPQSNFNTNSGPIVHVIRGDQRDIGQQRKIGHLNRRLSKAKRPRRRVFRNSVENGYTKTTVPRQQYNSESYPKVSLSRSASYEGPVYIMTSENYIKMK